MSNSNLVGQTLGGRYQIQSLIGQGGMASVYKAYDPNLRRAVAIKVIHPHLSSNPEFFRRFEEEATAVAHLRHPNIVQMYDYNHDGDLYFMVMEFVLGETLQTRLKRLNASKRRLSIKEVITFTAEICDAAFYAHQRGMIHRDIKPANIMLDVDGKAILMDFGIARMVGASQHTATGAVLGTAMYMSPEQIQGLQIDARADIYSIGVMLFEMLSGKPPFEADSAMTLMMMHLNDPVPDLQDLQPDTPPDLLVITNKALAKKREERYQSASELAAALRKLPDQAQKTPPVVSQPLPGSPEATLIEAAVLIDTGETIIEAPGPLTPAKEPSKPVAAVVKPPPAQPQYQPTLVEQVVQPVQRTAPPAAEVIPESIPGERKKSKAWIPILVVVLILFVGVGGYFAYSTFFAGGGINSPIASPTVDAGASLPLPITTEASITTQAPAALYTCTDSIGCVTVGPGEPVHIAYAMVINGPDATLGIDSRNGAEIALDEIGGKVLNHSIKFDGDDDGCSAEGGQAAGSKLAADPTIVAILGTSCSSAIRVAMPLWSTAGFTVVSSSNTAPDLTMAGNENNYPGYLRTAHNDTVQGTAAAKFAYESLGVRTAATIHDGSIYADSLQQVFADEFTKLGGTITAQESIAPDQVDMSGVLTSIASGAPEIIYHPIFIAAGTQLILQARQTPGLENVKQMGADGMFSPDVMDGAGDAVEGVYVSSPDFTQFGPDYIDKFLPAYEAKFGSFPVSIFHAHAYDAMNMVLACIEKVSAKDSDGTLHIPRQGLRDCMYATKDFKGLTGNLACSPTGDCADPKIAVFQYHAGQYPPKKIWPENDITASPAPVSIGGADKIAFFSGKNVWIANLDGTELSQLTTDNTEKNYLRWLPDGQALSYISGKCIETVSLSGEISQIACFNNADKLEGFEVSPDGKQVVIGLDSQVYLLPFDLESLSTAYSHDSLSALATCANMAPYTRNSARFARWSSDSQRWALVAMVPYNGMRADVVAVFPVDTCYTDNYAAFEVQFPPPHFTYPGYEKFPSIQDLGFDGNSLFALHGIVRNDGFGDLHFFNMDTFTFSESVNPINNTCCYRDAQFSPDGSYLVFAFQDITLGQASTTRLYYIPFGTIGTGQIYEPLPLPEITDPKERPQPVLRPAIP